jgi:hypothetical protein
MPARMSYSLVIRNHWPLATWQLLESHPAMEFLLLNLGGSNVWNLTLNEMH